MAARYVDCAVVLRHGRRTLNRRNDALQKSVPTRKDEVAQRRADSAASVRAKHYDGGYIVQMRADANSSGSTGIRQPR